MKYKGYELMQAIAENKLKLTQKVNSLNGEFKNCTIEFVLKNLAISIMYLEFEVIEEDEIDIQAMEECDLNVSCQELDHNLRDIQSYINYLVLPAIKQLDKQINCRVCGKELAVKYGVCEKCYKAANEDVR